MFPCIVRAGMPLTFFLVTEIIIMMVFLFSSFRFLALTSILSRLHIWWTLNTSNGWHMIHIPERLKFISISFIIMSESHLFNTLIHSCTYSRLFRSPIFILCFVAMNELNIWIRKWKRKQQQQQQTTNIAATKITREKKRMWNDKNALCTISQFKINIWD